MKWIGRVLIVLAFLAGVVVFLPASWLGVPLRHAGDGRWSLLEARGTVWHGEGTLAWQSADGQVLPASRLAWQWQPAALLAGRLGLDIASGGMHGQIRVGPGGWQAERLHLAFPLAAVAGTDTAWRGAGLSGDVVVEVAALARDKGVFAGNARITLSDAASSLGSVRPFGSYVLEVAGSGPSLALHAGTLDGVLQIQGEGSFAPGPGIVMQGTATTDVAHYEALKPLLLMAGQPDGAQGISWKLPVPR